MRYCCTCAAAWILSEMNHIVFLRNLWNILALFVGFFLICIHHQGSDNNIVAAVLVARALHTPHTHTPVHRSLQAALCLCPVLQQHEGWNESPRSAVVRLEEHKHKPREQ